MRRTVLLTLPLLFLPLLLPGCEFIFPDYVPYRFEDTYSALLDPSAEYYNFDDVDGDSRFEFWHYCFLGKSFEGYPNQIVMNDENMVAYLWQSNSHRYCLGALAAFFRYDPETSKPKYPKGLVILEKGPFKAYLTLINAVNRDTAWTKEIYEGKDLLGDGDWDGSIVPVWVGDLNEDSREEVLINAFAAFDRYPRGVWAFELSRGDVLWKHDTGCPVSKIRCVDLNGDGKLEVIMDTSAPCNGATANSTDDNHSYLIILDAATGNRLCCEEMGIAYSSVQTAAIDRHQEGIYLATCSGSFTAGAGFSRLTFWSGLPPTETNSFALPFGFVQINAFDADGDGKQEAIISSGHDLIAYGPKGRRKALTLPYQIKYTTTVKLKDPINREVLLVQGDSCLVGFGEHFKRLFIINDACFLYPMETPRLAVQTSTEIMLGSFVKTPLPVPYREMIIFGAGAALVVLFLLFMAMRDMPLNWKMLNSEFPCGVVWLNRHGKVRKANQAAKTLLPEIMLKPPEEIPSAVQKLRRHGLETHEITITQGSGESERAFHLRLRSYPHGVLALVWDKTDAQRSKFLRIWAEGIGRIVHFFKSPATTIQMGVQQIKKTGPTPETLGRLESQSELLIRYAARFKKIFTLLELKPEPVDVNQLLRRVMLPYTGSLPPTLEIDFQTEDEKLAVKADRDQMEIMLHCLIDNAVEALENNGLIKIRAHRVETVRQQGEELMKEYAEIEINDNGPGMDAQMILQAQKAGFTTKPNGMGLGLSQAKLITELHGGEFEISSQPGMGTTINVKLPLGEE